VAIDVAGGERAAEESALCELVPLWAKGRSIFPLLYTRWAVEETGAGTAGAAGP